MASPEGGIEKPSRRKFIKGMLSGVGLGVVFGVPVGQSIFGGRDAERTAGTESSNELLDDEEAFNRLITSFRDEDIKQISEFRPPAQMFGDLVDMRCANFDSAVVSPETIKRVKEKARAWFADFASRHPNFVQKDLKSAMQEGANRLWRKRGVEIAPR